MGLKKIGKYEIVRLIGKGSVGEVYKAFDPIIDRFVALKVIAGETVSQREFLDRFKKEVQAQGRVMHPNVAVIFDVNFVNGDYVIVMEYVDGRSLRDVMRIERIFTLRDFYRVASQACRGLHFAHSQGVIHRDIKPENIYLTSERQVKILDFSIAKLESAATTAGMGFLLGSAFYMAPEQIMGQAVTPATDQFSLAVVCFEMLTGKCPFAATTVADSILNITRMAPPAVTSLNPMVDSRLNAIIMRAMEKDPGRRFPSMLDLRRELRDYFTTVDPSLTEREFTEA